MKFHIFAAHYANDAIIPPDSIIGDGTQWSWRNSEGELLPLSTAMEGVDDEGREAIAEFRARKGLPPIQAPPTFSEMAPVSKPPAAHLEIRKAKAR